MKKGKKTRIERLEALAKGYHGFTLISWLEDVVNTYADVRTKLDGVPFEARVAVANIITEELINPLKVWRKGNNEPMPTGDESE